MTSFANICRLTKPKQCLFLRLPHFWSLVQKGNWENQFLLSRISTTSLNSKQSNSWNQWEKCSFTVVKFYQIFIQLQEIGNWQIKNVKSYSWTIPFFSLITLTIWCYSKEESSNSWTSLLKWEKFCWSNIPIFWSGPWEVWRRKLCSSVTDSNSNLMRKVSKFWVSISTKPSDQEASSCSDQRLLSIMTILLN